MRLLLAVGVAASVALSVIGGLQPASAATTSSTTLTSTTTSASDLVADPSSIGTPLASGGFGGSCVLTAGQAFHHGSVWTCWVLLSNESYASEQWTVVGPTSCAGSAWTCKTTFSPSSGTLLDETGVWVKIKTAIGNCSGYTLALNTTSGPLDIPVSCGSAPGASLVADPPDIGLPSDADGPCLLTTGVHPFVKGDVWTCYVALFANSTVSVPWIASWPTLCGWECKTTFSPSSGVAGPGGVWVKVMTAIGGCKNYTLSFKNPGKSVHLPVYCG
jgi:hypothetical protein